MKLKDEDINRVARDFLARLRAYMGQRKYDAAVKLNRTRRSGICHFHDYCDANMFMAAAIKKARGLKREISLSSDYNLALWNAAWDRAHEISSPRHRAELEPSVHALCEAVADPSASFVVMPTIPANSREMNDLAIVWAQEFEARHVGEEWEGGEGHDYIIAIDAYFAEKYAQWLATATDTRKGDFAT